MALMLYRTKWNSETYLPNPQPEKWKKKRHFHILDQWGCGVGGALAFIFLWETDKNLVFAAGWMSCDSKLHWLHETHVANLVPRVLSLLRERLVTCLCVPTQAAQRVSWVLNLILSTLSREVNVALLYGRYFEKEASYLSQFLPGQLLRIERELCFYFTAFEITVNNLFRISLISFSHQKNYMTVKLSTGTFNLELHSFPFVTENQQLTCTC